MNDTLTAVGKKTTQPARARLARVITQASGQRFPFSIKILSVQLPPGRGRPRPYCTITRAPGRNNVGSRIASQLANRMQPALWLRPIVSGVAVPCKPMPRRLVPAHRTPTGLFGPGGIWCATAPCFPCSNNCLSHRKTGVLTMLRNVHSPYGTNFSRPGVIGNIATKSPSTS